MRPERVWWSFLVVAVVAAMALLPGLGRASRLSYHEAIVAQAARELLAGVGAGGSPMAPTLDGRPWLEKPPMPVWLAASVGWLAGGLDEWAARLPSALAALVVCLAVSSIAARRFGPRAGLLAGLIQATTVWTVSRGRLAEADIQLAALIAATMAAFDRIRTVPDGESERQAANLAVARWAFFGLLGLVGLVKGVGFGVALVILAILPMLVWDRDRAAVRRLAGFPAGWLLALAVNLAWPLAMLARYPEAFRLWVDHVAGRFSDRPQGFSGEPIGEYLAAPLVLLLPWTPIAVVGVVRAWGRARRQRFGPDRLLIAWLVGPALAVSMARARNSHYLLSALPPVSIATAVSLERLAGRLADRGWSRASLRRLGGAIFLGLGLAFGLGYLAIGPRFDRRGREWSFYQAAAGRAAADEPLVLLYDDWDRLPYPTPFGPMPHDLAVRLFYLDRPTTWRESPEALRGDPPDGPFSVIGRDRDLSELARLGRVEELARGPRLRQPASKVDDRTFVLFRVVPAVDDRVACVGFADSLESGRLIDR